MIGASDRASPGPASHGARGGAREEHLFIAVVAKLLRVRVLIAPASREIRTKLAEFDNAARTY